MRERAVHDYGTVLRECWFVTRASKRHFPYSVCVSEEYSSGLGQCRTCELNRRRRQKLCVW